MKLFEYFEKIKIYAYVRVYRRDKENKAAMERLLEFDTCKKSAIEALQALGENPEIESVCVEDIAEDIKGYLPYMVIFVK